MDWQPIETAPLGEEIQVWTVLGWEPRARLIEHNSGKRQWQTWGIDAFDGMSWCRAEGKVTHWMPKPKPPAEAR